MSVHLFNLFAFHNHNLCWCLIWFWWESNPLHYLFCDQAIYILSEPYHRVVVLGLGGIEPPLGNYKSKLE